MRVTAILYQILLIPILFILLLLIRAFRYLKKPKEASVVFGGCGLINHHHWCVALQRSGLRATSAVWSTPKIYDPNTFEYDLNQRYGSLAGVVAPWAFVRLVATHNFVVTGFDGFLLGITALRKIEFNLLHFAGCRIILVPYGGDAYAYSRVQSLSTRHVLQISYPEAARNQIKIEKNISRAVRHGDFVISGTMGFDGIGRWDILTPNSIVVDTDLWRPKVKDSDGDQMIVAHTPNHRGFKGTEYLIDAVQQLQSSGLNIKLLLLENQPNESIRYELSTNVDVLVEQLVAPGYAMSAIEGMACGVVVVSNLEDSGVAIPLRRWSFLGECPIVPATPENIKTQLENLYFHSELRRQIQLKSREYAIRYHSYDSYSTLFKEIISYLNGERANLINFYHPLIGEYPKNRQQ
jgi:hypothetical protein